MTCYTLIRETWPKARKPHRCIWCGQIIPIGEQHCHEVSRYDDFQDYRWHRECRDEATTLFARGDIEFIPYENERPAPNGTPQRISEAKE